MTKHDKRVENARVALDGLSVGDALGEACAYGHRSARERILSKNLPPGPIRYTDDTELALAICEVLFADADLHQDRLAHVMARRYLRNPDRGYGKMARGILRDIGSGKDWRLASREAFSGGSMGNGAAMRVAPLGAYFADTLSDVANQAALSAQITHFHSEGIAGAIAVAVAAAVATHRRTEVPADAVRQIQESVLRMTPAGETRNVLKRAFGFALDTEPEYVAKQVGNGFLVTAPDTVPFCIWSACRSLHDYQEAFLSTLEVGGDCDTNCAIVG